MSLLLKFSEKAFEKWEDEAEIVAIQGIEYPELVYKKDGKYWMKDRTSTVVYLKEVHPYTEKIIRVTYK